MTELKTLKDLFEYEDTMGLTPSPLVSKEELKQEAIKWVEYYKNKKTESLEQLREMNAIIHFIKHFFNLTEEDLK
jgi:hypothetical protein